MGGMYVWEVRMYGRYVCMRGTYICMYMYVPTYVYMH